MAKAPWDIKIQNSKECWRCFIRQCSAAGHIIRLVKPATFGATTSIQVAYAQLEPTSKGKNAVSTEESVTTASTTQYSL